MFKRICASLCTLFLLFSLSSCQKIFFRDGITVELYVRDPEKKAANDVYLLQKDYYYKKCNSTPIYAPPGAPEYIEKRAGAYLSAEENYGTLMDYYISEEVEGYLYYSPQKGSTLLSLLNGQKKIITTLSWGASALWYMNDCFYLVNRWGEKIEVERIEPQTGESVLSNYPATATPETENIYLNRDASLFLVHHDSDFQYYAAWIQPDGTTRKISPEDPKNHTFAYIFETAKGYGLLETKTRDSDTDLFLRIRYFAPDGKELKKQEIDCKDILSRSDRNLFLEHSAAYHNGILYFSVCDYKKIYNYRYDLNTETLYEDAAFKGHSCEALRLLQCKDGAIYTLN